MKKIEYQGQEVQKKKRESMTRFKNKMTKKRSQNKTVSSEEKNKIKSLLQLALKKI